MSEESLPAIFVNRVRELDEFDSLLRDLGRRSDGPIRHRGDSGACDKGMGR